MRAFAATLAVEEAHCGWREKAATAPGLHRRSRFRTVGSVSLEAPVSGERAPTPPGPD
jgi:hypothetical protein